MHASALARPGAFARPAAVRRGVARRFRSSTVARASATADPNPDASIVAKAKQWPTWGCEASTFPWSYGSQETCLVIKGEATVTMDDGTVVELKPGTLATFPAGSSCVWDVTQALTKHYSFS
jgi:uncharacterized cupin superfamily protein